MSKGSKPRSGYNPVYRENWDDIFRKSDSPKSVTVDIRLLDKKGNTVLAELPVTQTIPKQ